MGRALKGVAMQRWLCSALVCAAFAAWPAFGQAVQKQKRPDPLNNERMTALLQKYLRPRIGAAPAPGKNLRHKAASARVDDHTLQQIGVDTCAIRTCGDVDGDGI